MRSPELKNPNERRYSEEEKRQMLIEFLASEDEEKQLVLKNYLDFLETAEETAKEEFKEKRRTAKSILQDAQEAEEEVAELVKNEIYPIVSIKREFLEKIKKQGGIRAEQTHIPELKLIVGTLGIEPYQITSDRVIFKIKCPSRMVKPRLTGQYSSFNGVVYFPQDFIPLDEMEEIKERPAYLRAAA